MATLPERIAVMMTWEFVVSSVIIAFIINVVAGVFLRKTIETPSVFKYRRLEQLKRQFDFTKKLHESTHQLLCFSFRGIGISIALLILASGVLTIPTSAISTYYNIHFTGNPPPKMPPCAMDYSYFTETDSVTKEQKKEREQCAQEMKVYNAEILAYNEQTRQASRNTSQWFTVFILIGSVIGAASFIYAIGLYRTLYMVANFKTMQKHASTLFTEDSEV